MTMLGAVVLPHPPLIVPQVGRGSQQQVQTTIDAYREAAKWLVSLQPDTFIILSPHAQMHRDFFQLSPGDKAQGNFGQFGAGEISFHIDYDAALTQKIADLALAKGLPADNRAQRDQSLDHGTMVPLYFLREAAGGSLPWRFVRIGLSGLCFEHHYRLGMLIRDAADKLGRKVCVIASGDLSHYLQQDGPYGFREAGPMYDARVMDILSRGAFGELLGMPEGLCEQAGECGQRSFLIMAGCFDGLQVAARQLSYEDVTGVGYGVVLFEPGEKDESRRFLKAANEDSHLAGADPYVGLARLSYEHYVRHRKAIKRPDNLPKEMTSLRAGVFVTLKTGGRLRGCIGTISPTTACIADEIIQNAISAATKDPRFSPLRPDELSHIDCSVDVLEEAEDIDSQALLNVKEYGVIVSSGRRSGLLLPNLEGVDTVEEQVSIARQKGGIAPDEAIRLQRFRVVRHI
ncbi:MAG: AmmeMemoRadiSam system protein A [Clostridiales bacterium]|nr:AmmeMemoRadiSam system protein A [Clostridiales bacterium]